MTDIAEAIKRLRATEPEWDDFKIKQEIWNAMLDVIEAATTELNRSKLDRNWVVTKSLEALASAVLGGEERD